ncbi:MAG: putative addiction module antidote protein [Burkholderiaceae bacterium]|nr:putative addiction module antidote protein [Burkholderiaceae bacterium]
MKQHASRPHDEAVVELLREDPQFAEAYLSAALAEADEPGGREGLLSALRQIAEAKGMANVASRAGIPRESMYRVLSPNGNPRLETLLAVIAALGLKLDVRSVEAV